MQLTVPQKPFWGEIISSLCSYLSKFCQNSELIRMMSGKAAIKELPLKKSMAQSSNDAVPAEMGTDQA